MRSDDERKVDPIREMFQIVRKFSNLAEYGFKESYRSVKGNELIYDSELCRINILWGGWDLLSGNSISIYYGRLHAPNESATMIWNGEECYAWHGFEHIIHFLDGRSPSDSVEMNYLTPLTNRYYEEEYTQKFRRRQPEWLMQIHMEVWKHYGNKFFELFDLQQPDLWENYRKFLKEFYDIKGRPYFIKPTMDKIC